MAERKFAGEPFVQVILPDYKKESFLVTALMFGATLFWILIFPLLMKDSSGKQAEASTKTYQVKTKRVVKIRKVTKIVNGIKTVESSFRRAKDQLSQTNSNIPQEQEQQEDYPLGFTKSLVCICGWAVTVFCVLMTMSPYNYYTARRIFSVPLLTGKECEHIVDMAHATAQRNYRQARTMLDNVTLKNDDATLSDDSKNEQTLQGLLTEPVGWQKARHGSYPTTDLNLVVDPFTSQDREWLSQHFLDRRLAPVLSRIYGIPTSSIRANDLFIVRYDAELRAHLANHTDNSDISFVCLLNTEFTGGGTRFWNRIEKRPFAHIQPAQVGECSLHSALIHHEGYPVQSGTRIIMVGFLAVDRVNPFVGSESTGLPWQASVGSWNWLQTKFKQALKIRTGARRTETLSTTSSNKYVWHLLHDLVTILQTVGDLFATHSVEELVADENRQAFLQALDHAYESSDRMAGRATWWKGQQIDIDLDGKLAEEWGTRKKDAKAFAEL